ncbi:glycosyltransferase [Rhodoferax sp. GW822-FHT02A01]|uniref:glycosyltransferase n=1 Tax=Rhodoferax sp. GW822-FHT02A01 TaxID=3141537 RepID=UPI00315CD253
MTPRKPRLVFVSPVFLFPNDAGGKIRTTNILRGLKGGAFDITLVSVADEAQQRRWAAEIAGVCDRFVAWQPAPERPKWLRALDLLRELPVNVVADRTEAGANAVRQLAQAPGDLIVFDFVHSAVLMPEQLRQASVCFTHNVEAEIFARHASKAKDGARRWMWSSQYRKMARFERDALERFTTVIAVSERDAQFFRNSYAIADCHAIPTGVDLDFFSWQVPPPVDGVHPPTVVFTGSMDWTANIDGVQYFLNEVWPLILRRQPNARFVVVGRNPPNMLKALGQSARNVEFTGFVDDVRPYVHAAHAFVIPLLVGGGTRIKAFEAMAMGCPIVSTSLGTEGLGAEPERHFLERDGAQPMADAVLALLEDAALRQRISSEARAVVDQRFGHKVAAEVFEKICLGALERHRTHAVTR